MAKILVVDDDGDTVDTLVTALEEAGHAAIGVVGWRGVPKALHQHLPEVILLDLLMPEVSGMDLLNMLRSHPNVLFRRIPIIVVTGTGKRTEAWCREHGAAEVIQKPCELERVLEAIERVVRG